MPAEDDQASREAVLRLLVEELNVKRTVACGDTVQVSTVTTTSERTVEEMLRRETADIRRVPVDREVEAIPAIEQRGDLTIIPVVKEVLVLRRQLVLIEEIHIRRVSTQEPFVTSVTLREQHAEITRTPPDRADPGRPVTEPKD